MPRPGSMPRMSGEGRGTSGEFFDTKPPLARPQPPAPSLQPLASAPFRAAGSVFERDAEFGEALTEEIGGGEILVLPGRGAKVDHQPHEIADKRIVARGFGLDRLAKQP